MLKYRFFTKAVETASATRTKLSKTANGVAATRRQFPESVKRDAAARREFTNAARTTSGTEGLSFVVIMQ